MAENSKIEWTKHTFNPWTGCQKVGPGCDHCYAEAMLATRLRSVEWGPHGERRRTSPANWRKVRAWDRAAAAAGERHRVFCASLADVFDSHPSVLPEWRADLWALIRETPHLDWMMLTKRPGNIAKMLPPGWGGGWSNVWLGCTIVNREEMLRDAPKLAAVPARIRFWSVEPMLGDLGELVAKPDLVICGGESGPGARPMHPDWARSLRDQCAAAGVAFFFKQNGGWEAVYDRDRDDPDWRRCNFVARDTPSGRWLNRAGGHGFHGDRLVRVVPVGKKAAGRLLDGREHNDMPLAWAETDRLIHADEYPSEAGE